MWESCRYCGSTSARELVLAEGEQMCPACAGSPLCDRCGHSRSHHTGVYTSAGSSCKRVWEELQTGFRKDCDCEGFVPVTTDLAEASFLNVDVTDGLPPLRVAESS